MIGDTSDNDPFIERIAKPLRAPERPDATFEARAMSAVLAAARSEAEATARRSWWLRPRLLHVSPIASLALAAGFAGLVLAGSMLFGSRTDQQVVQAPAPAQVDTVHVVRFVLVDPSARQVALVGAFNQWEKGATLMSASGQGVWTVEVPLTSGRHEYAFVVVDQRGERWVADPLGLTVRDEFGTESSVISVGTRASS
jgi:hypothetical protein